MKNQFTAIIAAVALVACSGNATKSEETTDSAQAPAAQVEAVESVDSTSIVKEEVEQRMNDFIKKHLDYSDWHNINKNTLNYFMTKAYKDEYKKCDKRAQKVGDEVGWIDYDPWIDAQDFEKVVITIKDIDVINPNKAIVKLDIKNFELLNKEVTWVREDGVMKIDNFTTIDTDMRAMMKSYLKGE